MRPRPPHSDAAHEAITAELVRLTLGGAPRPGAVRLEVAPSTGPDPWAWVRP